MTSPGASHRPGRFDVIGEEECWRLLDVAVVGRLGFTTDTGVTILPVNFVAFEQRIYVRTDPNGPMADLANGHDGIAFETDYHDDLFQSGWSILAQGRTSDVTTAEADRVMANSHRLGPWAPGDRTLFVALTPETINGRRISMH